MGVATGQFLYPNASPVANGIYQWKLSSDAIEFSVACIAPILFQGQLDTNGNMTATFLFNDVLSTACGPSTNYQLTVKGTGGGQVWNETYFLTGTAANLNAIFPSCGPGSMGVTTTATATLGPRTGLIGYNFSGGGSPVSAAVFGAIYLPVAMTATGWVVTADKTGTASLAILATSLGSYPAITATVSAPTLTGAISSSNLTITAVALPAGSLLEFSVTSASIVQTLNVGVVMSIPYA